MPIISSFPVKVDNDERYLQLSGAEAMTGDLNMGNHRITGVADPVDNTDAATKEFVENELTAALVGKYIPAGEKGTASGVAELDGSGKVPSSQLPSYVDDVVEYASRSAFPGTGESGKIYVALDANLTYRWSGSEYVEISPSLALGETESTAYRGDRGKAAYDHSQITSGNPHGTTAADVGAMPAVSGGTTGQVLTKTAEGEAWQDIPESGMTQEQADARYLQMQGTTTVAESIGAGPYTIEFTEESEDLSAFVMTFGAQSVAAASFIEDSTYDGWGYRASVPLEGVTADYIPTVNFGIVDASSGNLAPVAEAYASGVYIYAKERPTQVVNIVSVVCEKGVSQ